MIRLIALILAFAISAQAQQIQCVDTLAAAQYGKELKHIPRNFGIRGFAKKEFGDFFPVAKRELERGRPWVGVNLLWSDTHQFGDKDLPFVTSEAKRYEILCKEYPGKVSLTTFTEHNLQNPDKYHNAVQKAAPHCHIVNSVWQGAYSKKYTNEVHGEHPAPPFGEYFYSFDGDDATNSNVVGILRKHQRAKVFCVWHPRDNLKYGDKDKANRAQRVKEAADRSPDADMLLSQTYLFSNPGEIDLPAKWLVKSHAEKHDKNDTKGDKLLIISPLKADKIELRRSGKTIATLNYYGPFDGGGYRYYWNRFGYTAGGNLKIFMNGKRHGAINGGFRAGGFR
jgi:hypothetical protein